MKKVSLIIPCYNEEQALPIFAGELDKVRQELRQYDFEVLMVNDGSSDNLICFSSIWICRDCDATLFMETAKENKKACGYKRLCRWLCNRDFYAVHSLFS